MKDERPLTKHAKFLIKELSATLKLIKQREGFTEELKEEMKNLSQEMVNVLL